MKNYKEMADDVIRRIDEYEAAHKRKRAMLIRTIPSVCCVCLVALLVLGAWQSGLFDNRQSVTLEDSTDIGENDCNDESKEDNASTPASDNVVSEELTEHIETIQKEIAYEITTKSDYNKLALNFSELVKDADLILKIRVEDTNAFINDNGMIQTEITPIVQEVYKGSYDNEKLYVNGGEMLYDEFSQNEIIKKAVSGHENPSGDNSYKGKYIRQSVSNQYIFNCGEEYIFFAKKRVDSGKYYSLYAYQGTFKISNGLIENTALNNEEPLKKDICDIFNIPMEAEGAEKSEIMISEKNFIEKIKEMK